MSKEKSILFSHWDGGRGHINRVLDVAEESKKRGMRIGIITTAAMKDSLPIEFDNVYIVPTRPPAQPVPGYELPLYSHARSHGQRLKGLGFSRDFIIDVNNQELSVIDDFKPDLVVNDYRDTIKNVTESKSIPLVSIVQSNGHLEGQTLGWFSNVDDPDKPSCLGAFNEARESMGLDTLLDEREMFTGDYQIIPSIPEIDPVGDKSSSTHYVGMLSCCSGDRAKEDTLFHDPTHRYAVCNVVAPNRKDYGQSKLLESIPELLPLDIISTGESALDVRTIRQRLGTFAARQYVDYNQILPSSRVFVSYGGHGSTLSALIHGVPVIGLGPFSSEQRGTLENIQAYGAGLVVPHDTHLNSIRAHDMDNANIYGSWRTKITREQLVDALDVVTRQDSYILHAMALAVRLRKAGGSKRATDIIAGLA